MNFKGLILTIFTLYLYSCAEVQIKEPENLTVSEGFKNPIGFYNPKPTFSWVLPVSESIKYQSAYQIIVASSKDLLPNTSAKIEIPANTSEELLVNGVAFKENENLKLIDKENKFYILAAQSGINKFKTKIK